MIQRLAVVGLLGLVAACSPGEPPPSGIPVEVPTMTVTDALARGPELDGQRVRIPGTFWSDGQSAFLADLLLKSFPPQASPEAAIVLQGSVPAHVLARLEHAPAGLAPITWGPVEVVGRLHAGPARAAPRLEIELIRFSGA